MGGRRRPRPQAPAFGSPLPFGGRDAKEGEAGGSLLDRVKSRISSLRERLEADEEVETQAYVVEEASGGAPGAPAGVCSPGRRGPRTPRLGPTARRPSPTPRRLPHVTSRVPAGRPRTAGTTGRPRAPRMMTTATAALREPRELTGSRAFWLVWNERG